MGSNTFHLLVVQCHSNHFEFLLREKLAVRIGVGGINQDVITEAAMQRAIEAMQYFKNKIDEFGIHEVLAFGTSALRNATNGQAVIRKIKEATGIKTKIISGNDEARYIYEGVNLALKLGEEKALIMDIGGGSVEFIIGNGQEVFWKQSVEMGGQRLLERFQKHDPILPLEINTLDSFFNEKLSTLAEAMRLHRPKILIGSSGTFDTLSDIYCHQQNIELKETPETPLTLAAFEKICLALISKDRAQRMQIPGMIEMRVDMIVVACCLIKFVTDQFAFDRIRVSSYSLKEGVLASLMKSTQH